MLFDKPQDERPNKASNDTKKVNEHRHRAFVRIWEIRHIVSALRNGER